MTNSSHQRDVGKAKNHGDEPYLNGYINGGISWATGDHQDACKDEIAALMEEHQVNYVYLCTLRYVERSPSHPHPPRGIDRLGGTVKGCKMLGFYAPIENSCSQPDSPFRQAMVVIMRKYNVSNVRLWWGGLDLSDRLEGASPLL